MGLIIAKFRKKTTNLETLEKLDKEIKCIEDYRRNTEQEHKKIVGKFLLFSIGVYIISALLFYFYFYPANIKERLLYVIPLILAPTIIFSLKKLLTWYYNRKISKNQSKLVNLREEKKKLLDKVMETETYKVARSILEKYAPDQVRKVNLTSSELSPVKMPNSPSVAQTGVRNRFVMNKQPSRVSFGNMQTPSRPGVPGPSGLPTRGLNNSMMPTPANQVVPVGSSQIAPGTPLPRAILPRDRSVLDKMVEYLVGDGPANRFALICKQCSGHNGMALRDEFEYISYRCCYCYTFNPARKKRPSAPKLVFNSNTPPPNTDTSESEKNSGSDSDQDAHLPSKKALLVETLYSKNQGKISDNEPVSDFDKLSDLELKNSDSEHMEIDETKSEEIEDSTQEHRDVETSETK